MHFAINSDQLLVTDDYLPRVTQLVQIINIIGYTIRYIDVYTSIFIGIHKIIFAVLI
jgi:hypothetical protein